MEKIEIFRKMLDEGRISEEEVLLVCTEEELEKLFPSDEAILSAKEEKLREVLSLIQVRDAYSKTTAIGYSSKGEDKVLSIINKSIVKILEETYGE